MMRISTHLWIFVLAAALIGVVVWFYAEEESVEILTKPDVDTSCNVDADCVDLGGESCKVGCTWPMNRQSEDDAREWLESLYSATGGNECSIDCVAYDEPGCKNGECAVEERSF